MKKVHANIKSNRRCACGALLKLNLVKRKEYKKNLVCFACYQAKANKGENIIRTAREVRQNPILRSHRRWEKRIPLRSFVG